LATFLISTKPLETPCAARLWNTGNALAGHKTMLTGGGRCCHSVSQPRESERFPPFTDANQTVLFMCNNLAFGVLVMVNKL
jgi:hypothetical protein